MRFLNSLLKCGLFLAVGLAMGQQAYADLPPGLAMLPRRGTFAPNAPYCAFRIYRMDGAQSVVLENVNNPFYPSAPCNSSGMNWKLACAGYICALPGSDGSEYIEIVDAGHFRYVTPQGALMFYHVRPVRP
jgi:hypothetical protein